jgi:hypothetical protein
MSDDYEADDEDDGGNGHDHGYAPALDPFTAALVLIDLALNPKATKAALKKLAQLDKSIGAAEQKLAAVTAATEQKQAALAERVAELDAREAAITKREDDFAVSAQDVRNELYQHHNRLDETHRQLVHRIMATAGILSGWNPALQPLPTWEQLRSQIADLPPDPAPVPAPVLPIDAFSDTFSDPNADRHGNVFLGSLSRDVSHKQGTA